jgi:HEAT repeat protein
MQNFKPVESALVSAAALALTRVSRAAASPTDDLLARLRNPDAAVRGAAWQGAASYGAAAVKPLASLMTDDDFELARSARRALWVVVRHAGRPGATRESTAVAKELTALLANPQVPVRREVLWMLSEIGGDDALGAVAALLTEPELREDARCALTRIPGRKATGALKAAFATASEDFKYALADSLRRRGETVKGFPTRKLVPSRPTSVTHVPTG